MRLQRAKKKKPKKFNRHGGKKSKPPTYDFKFPGGSGVETIVDPEVAEAHRRLGGRSEDLNLAKRVVTLQRTKFPQGTLPELVTYDWLKATNQRFQYQLQAFGGRARIGGLVPDFIVQQGAKNNVWLVQGEYWHSNRGQQARDQVAINALRGAVINGLEIDDVVELWEDDIYRNRPEVFEWAMSGIGLRG